MSDTPTQAAALPEPLPCPFCGHVGLNFGDGSTFRWGIAYCQGCGAQCDETRREYPDTGAWHAEAIRSWNQRSDAALAQQAQELDALRAALRWSDVRTDGPPPCDGEAVFDGINSAGYPAAFNAYRDDGDCYMETAEGNAHVMGDLRYWRRHLGPATEGEANV